MNFTRFKGQGKNKRQKSKCGLIARFEYQFSEFKYQVLNLNNKIFSNSNINFQIQLVIFIIEISNLKLKYQFSEQIYQLLDSNIIFLIQILVFKNAKNNLGIEILKITFKNNKIYIMIYIIENQFFTLKLQFCLGTKVSQYI